MNNNEQSDKFVRVSAIDACMGLAAKTFIVTTEEMATHYVYMRIDNTDYELWLLQVGVR